MIIKIDTIHISAACGSQMREAEEKAIKLCLEHRCNVVLTFNDKPIHIYYERIINTIEYK